MPVIVWSDIDRNQVTDDLQDIQLSSTRDVRTEFLSRQQWNDLSTKAQVFLDQHKQRYLDENRSQWWQLRHLGYLYEEHQQLLVALVPSNGEPILEASRQVVRIYNVWNNKSNGSIGNLPPKRDCEKLVMWVRVNGPELFAGSAVPVPGSNGSQDCHWEFAFDLQVPGDYQVEVKVLLWNQVTDMGRCQEQQTLNEEDRTSLRRINAVRFGANGSVVKFDEYHRAGFQAFKLYDPSETCCTYCSRFRPWCEYWLTPALDIEDPQIGKNGCELLFRKDTPTKYLLQSHLISPSNATDPARYPALDKSTMKMVMGAPHDEPVGYFVGCGWNSWTLDFPCLTGNDDHIFIPISNLTLISSTQPSDTHPESHNLDDLLPLCTLENESVFLLGESEAKMPSGRWVRESWPSECGPMEWDTNFNKRFLITKNDGERPHCWHRDSFTDVGGQCLEMNCKFIARRSRWRSSVHKETHWMGVWRNYNCDYLEFTDDQLQQCFSEKKISSIATHGASIAAYLKEYIESRLEPLNMTNSTDPSAKSVVLSTLGSFHRGNHPTDADLIKHLEKLPNANDRKLYFW